VSADLEEVKSERIDLSQDAPPLSTPAAEIRSGDQRVPQLTQALDRARQRCSKPEELRRLPPHPHPGGVPVKIRSPGSMRQAA
jgi:hypothetical protein